MVVETSDENQFSYFYVLNPFLKLTRPDRPARPTSGEKLLSLSMPRICQLTSPDCTSPSRARIPCSPSSRVAGHLLIVPMDKQLIWRFSIENLPQIAPAPCLYIIYEYYYSYYHAITYYRLHQPLACPDSVFSLLESCWAFIISIYEYTIITITNILLVIHTITIIHSIILSTFQGTNIDCTSLLKLHSTG